jgi:hypothetical protein
MNNNNKPIVILAGAIAALFAVSFVVRFVALSQLGLPGGWMLLFCLPAGGVGLLVVLLRIGLHNGVSHSFGATTPTWPAPTKSQRLQEIDDLHATAAMSEGEYTAERARIISSL